MLKKVFTDPKVRYVAISKMVRKHMQEFYKIPDESIGLIYNGVDLDRFKPCSAVEKTHARKLKFRK